MRSNGKHMTALILAGLLLLSSCSTSTPSSPTGTETSGTATDTPSTRPAETDSETSETWAEVKTEPETPTETEAETASESEVDTEEETVAESETETDVDTEEVTEEITETETETEPETDEPCLPETPELGSQIELVAHTLTATDEQVILSFSTAIHEDKASGSVLFTLSDKDGLISTRTVNTSTELTEVAMDCPSERIGGELTLTAVVTDSADDKTVLDEITLKMKDGLPQLTADGIYCVIAVMTEEEKAHLVTGSQTTSPANASGGTYAIPRLGVPAITLMDGTAGVRYGQSVWYPAIMNLASSWDAELVASVGASTGRDALGKGFDIILSPGLNIQKNPLCGRHFEYFSEDSVLTGLLGAAFTNGMQSTGVGVALKHFAANNQESARGSVSANLTERALREIYLKGFGMAIRRSSPYSIMSSYNCINGIHTSVNTDLLDGILREEFGFDGMVMSDWDAAGNVVDKVNATNDINMPGRTTDPDDILKGLASGSLSMEALDKACLHILNTVVRSPRFTGIEMGGGVSYTQSRKVSEAAAADSMVLLKNEQASLPLADGTTVAVYGNGSVQTVYGGFGAASVTPAKTVSIMDGIRRSSHLSVYNHGKNPFLGCKAHSAQDASADVPVTIEQATSDAAGADVAVIVISRDSREGWDRTNTEGDFRLNATERDMVTRVSEAFHAQGKKVILLLNTGSPIEVVSWQDQVDAILWVGYAGEQTGSAVADILAGEVNPSGKLACTWPTDYNTVPDRETFPGTASDVYYYDDIYVGYRYYDTFGVNTAYSFGHGLSYTSFDYSDFTVEKNPDGSVKVSVTVTNVGKVEGREVVQLYVSKPEATQEQASHELCGFAKTALLAPGASERVSVTISTEALETYDTENSRWLLDAGTYTLAAAASLADIRLTATVTYSETLILLDTENRCTPDETFDTITKDTYKVPSAQDHVNLALGKEAWSNYCEAKDAAGITYEASRAVDGDLVTRWSGFGLSSGNHLWQVDLGEVYAIGEVSIRWQSLAVPFTVLISQDGESFTEVDLYAADSDLRSTLNLHGKEARYIRLSISRGGFVSIFEFEAYAATEEDIAAGAESDKKVNIAQGKPTTSTAHEGDYAPSNAVDGSTSTRWSSLPGGEAWWQVDLEDVHHIAGLRVSMESSWQPYRIEYSADGEQYTTLCSCEKDQLFVTLEDLNIDARYIRVVREGETWFSIYEVIVYGT